ncbi:class I SAM-dependent methyltransferase [Clostridium cadaveris]|uniref:class I SAM-dependent DNA methyltransferase n=1 Tax=Clostridium cadaveris TaxID=1529 RepID=UPI001E38A6A6|nr:class I SAM-dependent methyltransferase [Clostridium cadaveris]UFH63524.1 class I SAM-dependent methyltransferase [Clostridium cadaveris]
MDSYKRLSKIYDTLIYEDIDYAKISNKIISLCKEFDIDYNNYLDLACGTGTLSAKIGKAFKKSFLVDMSEDMLMEAYEKLKINRINATIICQDMSELNINSKFNLITCSLDSTNYIVDEENLKNYFKGVSSLLETDGIFIFDINSYYKLSEILGNNTYSYDEEDIFYSWDNYFEEETLYMNLVFFVKSGNLYERFDEEHIEKAYKTEYLDKVLNECGLQVIKKVDNYGEEDITDLTERITYVVKKK